MNEIEQALTRIFDRHRIVFWYDVKEELRDEFESLTLPGVEKIVLDGNQFGVKHRILRQEPEQRFLLYHEGPPPADVDNWLLDVELAHGQFRADQVSIWLSELDLGPEFTDVIAPHADFFHAARRREALKELLDRNDTPRQVRLKMTAVCANAEPRLDSIMEQLLAELAGGGDDDKMRLVRRSGLDDFLWEQLERAYGYRSETPGVRDFAIELFNSCYATGVGEPPGDDTARLTNDAIVFLKRWKDSVRHHEAFEALSAKCADILSIEQDLQGRDYRDLVAVDYFELIDRKILSELVRDVAGRTIAAAETEQLIRRRRQSHWYDRYEHDYEAIGYAAEFLHTLEQAELTMRSLVDGVNQYCHTWYRLDQLYRKFIYHMRQSGQATLLEPLFQEVENRYTNNYLLPLNNAWQAVVDASSAWEAAPIMQQRSFFEREVAPFLKRGNKVFVVISDAMRYEVGEELLRRVRQEDRYDADLEPALTVLPGYTQLGMAALLPHETLAIGDDGSTALVNGQSSQGTENRKKILERALPGRATALKADELLAMNREESRALFREHDVVYVYHNRIDDTGDKRESEERVFDAAEAALDELVRIIKKLANANVSNMLVTADHGFLYQHTTLDESDFISHTPQGQDIRTTNRRYVVGRGLAPSSSYKHFKAAEVGLDGEIELLIPKSINRLRIRGAGSRYVHGGTTPQEAIIPILRINKKRESDTTQVDVDILRGSSSVITTGQVTVAFYQTEPVTAKVQPRTLRAGIYTQAGDLISDRHDLPFDLTSKNPREREVNVRFVLTQKADEANGEEVILRLDERVEGTSHYREYKSARYLLRRAFTSDFDF